MGGNAAGAVIGFIGDQYTAGENKRFAQQQGKVQYKRQRELNQQGADLAYDMWKKTNYSAQMMEADKAGLNKNLLYGGSGGGGVTASTGSGGSAPSVQAKGETGGLQAGISQATSLGMMKTQQDLMKAQQDNMEANTNKVNVESGKLAGVDTDQIRANTEKTINETQGVKIQNEIQGETKGEQKEQIASESVKARNEATVSTQTIGDAVSYIKAEAIGRSLENALTEARTGASLQEVQNMKQTIRKMQAEISQGWEKLDQTEREVQIKKLEQELKALYPNLGQVWGGKINEAMRDIDEILQQQGGNYHGQKR